MLNDIFRYREGVTRILLRPAFHFIPFDQEYRKMHAGFGMVALGIR